MKTSSIFSAFLALATLVVSQSSLESSQIEAINSEINQSYSQASSAFNSKVGAIKSKISRQQLNQGFATIDLNLPATYKKMFDDIAASEKLVQEYQQLSEVVGKMAVEANKLVKTPAPDSAFGNYFNLYATANLSESNKATSDHQISNQSINSPNSPVILHLLHIRNFTQGYTRAYECEIGRLPPEPLSRKAMAIHG